MKLKLGKSSSCKKTEERSAWMGRPLKHVGHIPRDNTPNSFCRMVSISVIDLLAIPYHFDHTWLGHDCPETIKLKTSTGCIWGVVLKKEDGKIFMDEMARVRQST
jgi:hypothetical protein